MGVLPIFEAMSRSHTSYQVASAMTPTVSIVPNSARCGKLAPGGPPTWVAALVASARDFSVSVTGANCNTSATRMAMSVCHASCKQPVYRLSGVSVFTTIDILVLVTHEVLSESDPTATLTVYEKGHLSVP